MSSSNSNNNNTNTCQQQQEQPIHLPAGAVDPVLNLVAQRIFELSLRQQRHQQCFTAQAQAEMTSLVSQYPSVAQQLYGGRQSRQYPLLNVLQWQPSLELVQQLVQAFPAALLATENGFRPLDLACWKNAPLQVVQYLHQQDSTAVSTLCQGVMFPLHIALHHFNNSSNDNNNSEEVVQFLLDQYPQAASQPDAFGKLPLHHAAASGAPLSILQRLVSLGPQASTRQQDKQGWTPLHYACRHGRQQNNAAVVAFLLQQQDQQQQQMLLLPNQNGNTPLDLAAMYQTPAVLHFLLSQQQQVEPEQDEEPHITLLHLAARCNQADTTQFLAERYPWMLQVVSPCSQNTPLHYACERDDDAVEVVRVLMKTTTTTVGASLRRCNYNKTNNDNKLPLCLARDNRNRQVVRLLKQWQ